MWASLKIQMSPSTGPPVSAALSITALTAKDITPTKIGSPLLPCTSVSPVSAW